MNLLLHCIALRSVPIADTRTLVSAWSRETGYVTFCFPAGNSREAKRRRALATPLALFEGRSEIRPSKDILSLRDFSPIAGSPALAAPDISRTVTAPVIAEILDRLLRHASPDEKLSDYIFEGAQALAGLSRPAACANFHIVFLFGLTAVAGITPDLSEYAPGRIFDLREGFYRTAPPLHTDYLESPATDFLPVLARANYKNMHKLRLSRTERREALLGLLKYFSIHLEPLDNLKSLAVLSDFG